MNSNMLKAAIRNFFRIKPIRDASVTTKHALIGVATVVLTQITDAASTIAGIEHGGAAEANGAMADLMASTGYGGFILVKLAGAAFLSWYTWRRPRAPFVVASIYGAVTIWNLVAAFLVPALLA